MVQNIVLSTVCATEQMGELLIRLFLRLPVHIFSSSFLGHELEDVRRPFLWFLCVCVYVLLCHTFDPVGIFSSTSKHIKRSKKITAVHSTLFGNLLDRPSEMSGKPGRSWRRRSFSPEYRRCSLQPQFPLPRLRWWQDRAGFGEQMGKFLSISTMILPGYSQSVRSGTVTCLRLQSVVK